MSSSGDTGQQSQDCLDGLLSHEKDSLLDRVNYLEKRTSEQTEEISCLKSALADCLRRINQLELNRVGPGSGGSTARGGTVGSKSSTSLAATKRGPSGSRTKINESGVGNQAQASLTPTGHKTSSSKANTSVVTDKYGKKSKEPVFFKDNGILRTYLRGRAINVYAPTNLMNDYDVTRISEAPEETLKLEWVYGYRGRDCRNNVHYLPTGEVVYFVASVVVLYNMEEQFQRHYIGHTDDVKCIAIHPDRITVATGQVAGHDKLQGKPHIRIWSSVTLSTLHVLGLSDFDRAICCLAFSKSDGGNLLCAVDEANDHVISVWDWQKQKKITEAKSSTEPVLCVEFHPLNSSNFVTCGKSHLAFWNWENSKLSKKMGLFDKSEKPKYVLCMTFSEEGDLFTGDSSGNILVWPFGSVNFSHSIIGAHDGSVFSLCMTKNGLLVSGGGKDRRIIQWDGSYTQAEVAVELPESYGSVRTIAQGPAKMLFVGTTKNSIIHLPSLNDQMSPVIQGHTDELWCLAVHPVTHHFLSGGRDKTIFLWDALSKRLVWSKELTEDVHCASFYPATETKVNGINAIAHRPSEDLVVAVGTASGRWLVLDTTSHEFIAVHSDGNGEQIECISFSPDGNYLALGGRDNFIYVYSVLDFGRKYSRVGRCAGHSSFILHLDWSSDSHYIRSCSGDYELLFWTANNCKQITSPSSMRDTEWASQFCTIGWEVAGIWPENSDGTDINACQRSNGRHLLTVADDFGKLNLFRYPACQPKAQSHSYIGHSSHVTNTAFLYDDSRVISCGGKDTAILQWEVCT